MQSTLTHPYSQDIRSNFRYLVASIFHSKTFVLAAVALGLLANLPSVQAQGSGGDLSGIAEREIARRANLVVEADKALALGRTAYSKSQYQEAVNQYRIAVNLLPPGPALADRRQSYTAHLGDAVSALSQEYRRVGKTDEARNLLQGLLAQDPTNLEAKKQLEYLDDPIRTNPVLTFDHTVDVDRVRKHLYRGEGHYNLGKYDEADAEFKEILRIDPYNKAARRWLERIAVTKSDYYRAAYDQTRAELLKEVDKAWESSVPPDLPEFSNREGGSGSQTSGVQYLQQKLNNIIIPVVDFEGVTIQECVETLRLRAREFDTYETDEEKKGINIMMADSSLTTQGGGEADADALDADAAGNFAVASDIGSREIDELRLTNVPLGQVLTYICNKTRLRYVLDDYTITILPAEATDTDVLYTRTFIVPPDFISRLNQGPGGGGIDADPFADDDGGSGGGLGERASAKTLLMDSGVSFPGDAFANFIASSSTLVVKNTLNNLDLIDEIVAVIRSGGPRQVRILTKFIEISQENTDELGFDWIINPIDLGGNGSNGIISGGTTGNGSARAIADLGNPNILPGATEVSNIVTSGLRSGDFANSRNSIDAILNNPERSGQATNVAPGILSLTGLFDNGQAQMIIRGLQQRKGVDVMTAPSILARSGDSAKIEVIREFIYPTEYEPPELPQSIGGGIGGGNDEGGGSVEIFPVTPATPTGFEVRNTGVTLLIEPTIAEDNYAINLIFSPELVEFEGFINYGSPIQTLASDLVGNPVSLTITENRIEQPIFSTRRVETSLTIYDGYTVSVGGLMREDVQNVEDSVPILGDLPIIGRLFQSKAENRLKSNLVIFVSAEIIDAAGARINQTGTVPEDLPSANIGLGGEGLLPTR